MSTALPIATTNDQLADSSQDEFDLVAMLLDEQQSLTAVERFSALHDQGDLATEQAEPAQAAYYRSLLPATAPGPGQQFAFHVNLDKCSGCKACVVACHTMNGLEDDESWRRVGTITLADSAPADAPGNVAPLGESKSRIQHVTTACHHCEDPGCLRGCPVKAYEKDPVTGIVRHLDDQCIGCKYCTMMCPYEVPQYSKRLGIVRKCDMCHQRLSVGEAPACVQSCPTEAISINIVETAEQAIESTDRLVAGAPLSTITRPSTVYASRHRRNNATSDETKRPDPYLAAVAQDWEVDEVAESHWPLAAMLIATQISVGMLVCERFAAAISWLDGSPMPIEATRWNASIAWLIAAVGMNVAPLHLGRPLRAWRVFLGLRTSWLSREAIILGKYMAVLTAAVALLWFPSYQQYLPPTVSSSIPTWSATAALLMAIPLGIAGLLSSAMIYIATARKLWRYRRTLIRFLGTSLACGAAWTGVALLQGDSPAALTSLILLGSLILTAAKLDWEYQIHLGPACRGDDDCDRRSRRLVANRLASVKQLRLASGAAAIALIAGSLIAILLLPPAAALSIAILAAVTLTLGESCERWLYFCSVVYDRMPGTLR